MGDHGGSSPLAPTIKEIVRNSIRKTSVLKLGNETRKVSDVLAVEEPLEIKVSGKSAAVTMRTPGDDFELAAGFLFTEGVINSEKEILSISYCATTHDPNLKNVVDVKLRKKINHSRLKRNFYATSSCGICGKAAIENIKTCTNKVKSELKVRKDLVASLPDKLRKTQEIFRKTGSLHAAAIFNEYGELLITKEDVGRHNAVDKAIGEAVLNQLVPFERHMMMVSGRTSFEIMQKAAMASIPLVLAISAPSSLAVQFAKEFNMTLIGMVRGNSMNVYSGEFRIKV